MNRLAPWAAGGGTRRAAARGARERDRPKGGAPVNAFASADRPLRIPSAIGSRRRARVLLHQRGHREAQPRIIRTIVVAHDDGVAAVGRLETETQMAAHMLAAWPSAMRWTVSARPPCRAVPRSHVPPSRNATSRSEAASPASDRRTGWPLRRAPGARPQPLRRSDSRPRRRTHPNTRSVEERVQGVHEVVVQQGSRAWPRRAADWRADRSGSWRCPPGSCWCCQGTASARPSQS